MSYQAIEKRNVVGKFPRKQAYCERGRLRKSGSGCPCHQIWDREALRFFADAKIQVGKRAALQLDA